jgi:hypothetical protein
MHAQSRSLYEWAAAVDFFNQINLLYGSIAEFCNDESCPVMNAGKKYGCLCVCACVPVLVCLCACVSVCLCACGLCARIAGGGTHPSRDFLSLSLSVWCACVCRFEYFWADGKNIKSPIKCSAPDYMEHLMTWVQEQLDDETIFPNRVGMSVCLPVFLSLCVFVCLSVCVLVLVLACVCMYVFMYV